MVGSELVTGMVHSQEMTDQHVPIAVSAIFIAIMCVATIAINITIGITLILVSIASVAIAISIAIATILMTITSLLIPSAKSKGYVKIIIHQPLEIVF